MADDPAQGAGAVVTRSEPLWRPGNSACAGCGMSLGLQWLDQALHGGMLTLVVPACCAVATPGAFPDSAYGVPAVGSTFASSPAVATGVSRVHELNDEPDPTICWAGDGGTYDIGMATLSAAAERNEDVIYVCYDNEIYGNTGGQRSSATPAGARTTTTPAGKPEPKKDVMAIMAAHGVPYAATLSLAHHDDFMRKLAVAQTTRGFRFLLLLSPCPAGWKSEPADTVELSRLAVACGVFPLYEVFNGRRYRINARADGTPLEDYLARQKRFAGVAFDVEAARTATKEKWARLEALAANFPTTDVSVTGDAGHLWLRVLVEDRPSVLARVAGQVSRRGVNIETVVVRHLPDRAHTYITLGVDADEATAERVARGIARLDAVVDVEPFVGECPEPQAEQEPKAEMRPDPDTPPTVR
ncbi:MAG: thiamine pyrophosphate-dependent enzyme [Actinobacteria bacterium]|nr:thiamine pyrophosphate-dependent enzyme [Actinomycetota bacterium]